jgi:hypothetical protein
MSKVGNNETAIIISVIVAAAITAESYWPSLYGKYFTKIIKCL